MALDRSLTQAPSRRDIRQNRFTVQRKRVGAADCSTSSTSAPLSSLRASRRRLPFPTVWRVLEPGRRACRCSPPWRVPRQSLRAPARQSTTIRVSGRHFGREENGISSGYTRAWASELGNIGPWCDVFMEPPEDNCARHLVSGMRRNRRSASRPKTRRTCCSGTNGRGDREARPTARCRSTPCIRQLRGGD